MASQKPCLGLKAYFMLEGHRMIEEAMQPRPGESIKAQLARAAISYKLPFDFVWRVYQHRCGSRAFLRLYAAYRANKQGDEIATKLAELGHRIDQLADIVEASSIQGSASHSGDPRRHRLSHSPA